MADKGLFSRLNRLFSTDVLIRNVGGNTLKVADINKIQVSGELENNALVNRFNKIYTGGNTSLLGYQTGLNYKVLRPQLYSEYDNMDTEAIIASALDIIADESTLKNDLGEVLQIKSSDENIQKILYNLFYDVMNIEFNLWPWVRNLCKYGDFFLKLEISEEFGVYNVIPYTAYHMDRVEQYDEKGRVIIKFPFFPDGLNVGISNYNINNIKDINRAFDNYEIAHFRLLSDMNMMPYGRSFIEPARKVYKQYILCKDAMLIHRIVRAPEKRIFYMNVGGIPPNEVDAFMEKTISKMKRTPYVDPQTGEYNLKYNMGNMLEDYYIPVRGNDSVTKIEKSDGLQYDGIQDVEFLRNELFAALKIPQAFMGYSKDLEGKCIDPLTKIPLLDGRTLTAYELIEEHQKGIKNYVYSINEKTHNIVPGEIEWAGMTRLNTNTIKVWLDNGEFIRTTPDHKFMLRTGEWVEAQHLKPNDSLMPLYRKKSENKIIRGYDQVYNPLTGNYEFTHRIVAEYYSLKTKNNSVIHHSDCNKLNNNPENLDCSMDFWEHRQWHLDNAKLCHTPEANLRRKETWMALGKNEEWLESQKERFEKNSKILVEWIKKNGASRKGYIKYKTSICKGCGVEIDNSLLDIHERYLRSYCNDECKRKNWNCKYKSIPLETLIQEASDSNNFIELKSRLNIKTHNVLKKVIQYHGFESDEFIIKFMPKSHTNIYFMNQFPLTNEFYIENYHPEHKEWKKKYSHKNHKVSRIEICHDLIDTCDISIKDHHNFGTEAGVIIHNSTLSAQDIRFARTIERIQRIMISELYKIAVIHLYAQGYKESSLLNFELSLTTPSIIYDQERIALLKEKVEIANQIIENNLMPSDWVYENIFHMSEDMYEDYRDLIVQDAHRKFRITQITEEGNDPVETGKSYGTPHDLASLYGPGRYTDKKKPEGYDENELGRPEEKVSDRNTQKDNFGKDRLGVAGMKKDPDIPKRAMALESNNQMKSFIKSLPKGKKKKLLFERKEQPNSLLDESNIKDEIS